VSCSELSLEAGIPLAGTATRADSWLLVEHPGPWGRDPVADTELPPGLADVLLATGRRVMFVRRPGRPNGVVVYSAETTEEGGTLRRIEVGRIEDVVSIDPERDGAVIDGPLVLVCAHRRRDACCGRLGVPVFNALRVHVQHDLLWRSSHHGGHRFAANVLALPYGVQLGRVRPAEARAVATALAEGRIPLEHYRGRSHHTPEVQAAEATLRRLDGLDRIGDVRLVEHDGDRVTLEVASGVVELSVTAVIGPSLPASCGAAPEPTTSFVATVVRR
jgi:hypothetical protein